MKKLLLLAPLAIAGVLAFAVPCKLLGEEKNSQTELREKAKVSEEDARKTALKQVPGGKIKEGELEEENGLLIWSFDIAKSGSDGIVEVQVNAITGAVASVKDESAKDEAQEQKKDGDGK